METRTEIIASLERMKDQEPFHSFDVITVDGDVLPVTGRYLFAFNRFYAIFADDQGRPVRVRLEKISKVAVKH